MTITRICSRIKHNVVTIVAAVVAALFVFIDVSSVFAFKGYAWSSRPPLAVNRDSGPGADRPSGSTIYGRGEKYPRADPGPRPRYHPGDRAPGPGPGNYRNDPDQRFYRGQPLSPYGGLQRGGYGERKAVRSRGDAQRMLNDYYMRRGMSIGPVRENRFYFEADIMDRDNRFVDRVIIDKRSGRIRSVY
jgi:hypothetical protein